jgi:tetratricopeptide (TPR) repeat protein
MRHNQLTYIIAGMALLLASCMDQKDKDYSEIKSVEKILLADQEGINDSLAMEYAAQCEQYAKQYKDDAQSPELLFKAGEVLSGIGRSQLAIRKFQDIYQRYPNFSKAPECIFLCGFIYDNNLQDYKEAKFYYEMFLEKYPKHPLAKDAQASIDNLGRPIEDLIKEFESKNDTI